MEYQVPPFKLVSSVKIVRHIPWSGMESGFAVLVWILPMMLIFPHF